MVLVLQESLSTYLSIKPKNKKIKRKKENQSSCISQHLRMLFLLSEGHFLGFLTQAKSQNLTPCNSGDSRKVAVLENGGAGD